MKKLTIIIASVLVIAMVIAGALGFYYLERDDGTEYYAVEIYVLNWDMNATGPEPGIDVVFQISIDSDDDGDFDAVGKSRIFNATTVEVAPFRFGTTIPTSVTSFSFKIEVFKVVGSASSPLAYTDTGTSPLNRGYNEINSTLAWTYDGTTDGSNELACRLSYFYFVNDVAK
ncbi:MAG TPA: hypothetical protein P5202_04260 [Methanomassiliicoccales archaeon]|nr:hypothetical protein [Methanomassiliicoccales archaeon]